ncbi:MAG TPA: PmoA family protein [Pirellulales bacterium]|nr:PmoA family protein [Pirellulales bacterium]
MFRTLALVLTAAGFLAFLPPAAFAAKFALLRNDDGVRVEVDGQLFTAYLIDTGPKPILWPVIGPTGAEMTRAFPLEEVPDEKHDHPHQRSLWFTHGNVNGVDFWSETPGHGSIAHREYLRLQADDDHALITTRNDWLDASGKKVLQDFRHLTFRVSDNWRSIDYDITLNASEVAVKFGDTKEGSMGIRIPTVMDVNSQQGGHIVNSEGDTDKDAWGKPASWVDYYGTLDGQSVGIAFLNHPESFRYPTRWHVRDYGLFAANPFGLRDFVGKPDVDGACTLPQGESITLRYRIVFHKGDAKEAKVEEMFERYGAAQ